MIAHRLAHRAVRRSSAYLAVLSVLTCVVPAARADDDDIVNSHGFESPFTTGPLEGQVNYPGEGQIIPPGQWLRSHGGDSTAVVQSAVFAPGGGSQAVRLNRAANSDVTWAVPVHQLGYPDYPNPFPPEPAQPNICISCDMRVEQTVGGKRGGPFFGVEAYDDRAGAVGLLGSLGVDAVTGDVLYQATGTGFFTETGRKVSFGQWNHFAIMLDYSTDQYSIFHNFLRLGTFGFVDPGLDQFSAAGIATLDGAGDPDFPALPGTAYFDNFLVREGACPNMLKPADFDRDDDIDAEDLDVWKASFGPGAGADADGDLDSDGADFLIWQRDHFVAPGGVAAIPEPATLALVVWGALAMFLRLHVQCHKLTCPRHVPEFDRL